jgi:2-dehydro-3-deoxygluconokinase
MIATLGEGLLEVGIEDGAGDGVLGRGFGGDAANVAVMVARMGVPSRLITRVGGDAVGRLLLSYWRSQGVDVAGVDVDHSSPTGIYTNATEGTASHTFGYYRTGSAATALGTANVEAGLARPVRVLHTTGITMAISPAAAEAARCAITSARARDIEVTFDFNFRSQLAPDPIRILEAAREADVVFVSDDEAEAIIGSSDPAEILAALGPVPREVLITQGAGEVALYTAERSYRLRPPRVEVVNAAGAGDAFAGAYLAAREQDVDSPAALAMAVGAASISCTRSGCARGYPDGAEVRGLVGGLGDAVVEGLGMEALVSR